MLQGMRDRLTGPMVWVIVGIIVVPFAFFGIEQFRSGGADPTLAKVGDQKITQSQFRASAEQRMQQLQRLMGENFRPDLIDQTRFRQSVLDDMVQETVLRQHVQDAGYRAPDAAVFDAISVIPAFQENGKFSSEAYRNRLASNGFTPARFETQVRESLVIDQMREGILDSALVTDAGVAQGFRLDQQQRELSYAVFEASRQMAKATVEPAKIQERYDQQKTRFQSPERLRVAYVELALENLPAAEKPTDEYLRSIYEADKATRFSTPEERRARHILISFGADKDAARQRLESLASKIGSGADFASLAGSHSEDPGSKDKGGDLGWVKRGQMVDKFEQALFALKAGAVSAPVETEFGWHLIKLEELRAAQTQPFDDAKVQAELLKLYRQKDAERRYKEMSEKLETIAFESPTTLEPAVKELGLELKTSEWFTRTAGTGIAEQAPVREAAFSEDVLTAGENSRPLNAGENRVVVLRKQEYEAPRQKPLEEVQAVIRDELMREAASVLTNDAAGAAVAAALEGRALEPLVRGQGTYKAPTFVRRTGTEGVDPKIVQALFRMKLGAEGKPVYQRVALANGDVAIVGLSAIREAAWAEAQAADQVKERRQQREAAAGAEFAAYRADLQKRIDVKVLQQPEAEPTPE